MPVLLLLLLVAVLAYLYWRRRTTTLTRDCRWRLDQSRGHWRCAFCGATREGPGAPTVCRRQYQHGRG